MKLGAESGIELALSRRNARSGALEIEDERHYSFKKTPNFTAQLAGLLTLVCLFLFFPFSSFFVQHWISVEIEYTMASPYEFVVVGGKWALPFSVSGILPCGQDYMG